MRHLDKSIVAFVGNKTAPEEKGDGRALWKMLRDKFVGSGVKAQGVALDKFLELKFRDLNQWIEDLRTTTRRMSLTGTDVNNALVTRLAIRTLPNKYESLIRTLTYGNQYPNIEDIIVNVEKDRALFQVKTESKEEVALPADRETRTENEEEEPTIAFVAINSKINCALMANKQKQTILDSGANNHMFTSESDFIDLKDSTGGVQIGQEGVKIPIRGRGNVIKQSDINKIIFKDTLYVPDLPYNLISLSQIWKEKGDLERLHNNKFQVVKNKTKTFGGHIENGLLHIDFEDNKALISKHKRLGHTGKSNNCEACKIGKSTRIAFNGNIRRPDTQLEEISIDLMGPITPKSLGGARYILVVVDS
ncbi:hypothetical protein O181_033457 [Austropuccinia psidii MF-1]|uniref:Retrovirus-related Pol polyprotein from transposon TNT 1-94-like beta-barrel domain-containing protein n=1 Tax=Austropuccinia psidii MF-1 TaxID=1389203 RepID=A0A9Q3D4N4_9BASI|nr:hypothetical protein [Austropuccinia psidii MF-1]